MNLNRLTSLQVLRAIAAFLVLFTHIFNTMLGRQSSFHLFYSDNFGAIGVDIFFVLSGAVMTIITYSGREKSALDFFLKRCRRIIPPYWLISAAAFVIWYICRHEVLSTAEIIKTLTILPLFNAHHFGVGLLTVGWTLSFEFFFYIIFSFSVRLNPLKASVIAFIIIAALVLLGVFVKFTDARLIFFTNPIMIEFLLGCICAWVFLSPLNFRPILAIVLLVGALIWQFSGVFAGFTDAIAHEGNTEHATYSLQRSMEWGLPSFVTVLCFLMAEKSGVFKAPGFAVKMGDASYALYLLHVPIITIVLTVFTRLHLLLPNLYFVFCMFCCLTAAYYFHVYVEMPMLRLFTNLQLKLFKKSPAV